MKFLMVILLWLSAFIAFSQPLGDLNKLVQGSRDDSNYLLTAYTRPLLQAIPYGLNQGWYNTAKPHRLGGFDLVVYASMVSIPAADLSFTIDNSKLSTLRHVKADGITNSTDPVPTVFGTIDEPRYNFKQSNTAASAFDGPGGFDLKKQIGFQSIPVPMFNLGIGLPGGFEVKGRFFPKTTFGKTTVSLWGVGGMYDLMQHFSSGADRPFDLSVFGAYTVVNSNMVVNNTKNQHAEFAATAATFQALISKKISLLTVYGGAGYNMGWSGLKVLGVYDLGLGNTMTNPLDLPISGSGLRFTGGGRIKLSVLVLSFDYTLQKYSTATAGIGFDFGGDKVLENKNSKRVSYSRNKPKRKISH